LAARSISAIPDLLEPVGEHHREHREQIAGSVVGTGHRLAVARPENLQPLTLAEAGDPRPAQPAHVGRNALAYVGARPGNATQPVALVGELSELGARRLQRVGGVICRKRGNAIRP
jgi:hypothetical protein